MFIYINFFFSLFIHTISSSEQQNVEFGVFDTAEEKDSELLVKYFLEIAVFNKYAATSLRNENSGVARKKFYD